MRTTLDIADDVLFAAKDMARQQKVSLGAMLSTLARSGLTATRPAKRTASTAARLKRFGIVPLPECDGVVVTNELVNRIREQEGI